MREKNVVVFLLPLIAAACGGDGTISTRDPGGSVPIVAAPPTVADQGVDSMHPGPLIFTKNVPGTSDIPLFDFADNPVASVVPQLPAGLEVDVNTGLIVGTPTVAAAAASYVISLSNAVGRTLQTTVVLEVSEGPFFYSSPAVLTVGAPMALLSPRGASGTAVYTVTPPLPAGLTIDPATGVISGTPVSVQPFAYYLVSRAESLLTQKFGLTLGVGTAALGSINTAIVSTLSCQYSGGFIGTFTGGAQANDAGLVAIAFMPNGQAVASVLDFSNNTVQKSDGLSGLSEALDGSFDINFSTGAPSRHIQGAFSGGNLIVGSYETDGTSKPFQAARLGGSPDAKIRYTGGFGTANVYRVDFGVLDATGAGAIGVGYQFKGVGRNYRLLNRQLGIQGNFTDSGFTYSIPDDGIGSSDAQLGPDLQLNFGDPYDELYFAQMVGCRLNP